MLSCIVAELNYDLISNQTFMFFRISSVFFGLKSLVQNYLIAVVTVDMSLLLPLQFTI